MILYRISLRDLQESVGKAIDCHDHAALCNFVTTSNFTFTGFFTLGWKYSVDEPIAAGILQSSFTINQYLQIQDPPRSCMIWVTPQSMRKLVDVFYVDEKLFTADQIEDDDIFTKE